MYRPVLFFMIIYAFIGAGCSGANAVTSDNLPLFSNNAFADFLPVARTGSITYEGIIGAFSVVINTETLTGEVLPLRRAGAIGDSFDSHITEFMNKTPCSDCVKLSGIALSSEHNIKVNFKIRHPFTDLLKRPDLHVFDVRGILLHPGGVSFGMILSDVDGDGNANEIIQTDPDFLLNADGYTTHFDDSTLGSYFDPPLNYPGNLNAFKNFFLDPTSDSFDPYQAKGHNVMKVNSGWDTQTYIFNTPPEETFSFTFIVDASYGQSATRFTRDEPEYYLPEFNRKEAWQVTAETYNDTLEEGQVNSSVCIRVYVKDWQAQRNRDEDFPDSNNLPGLKERSDVDQVEISCPDFGFFEVKSRLQAESGGNGTNAAPYVFIFGGPGNIETGPLQAGMYYGLIAVRDDLVGLGGPLPIEPHEGDDFPSRGPDITDYTAYQIIPIEIRSPGTLGCPPIPVDWSGCLYSQAFGVTQHDDDTVLGVSGSLANILDIDFGVTGYPGEHRFALEQSGVLGVAWDSGSGGFLPFRTGEPGYRVSSIDVDSQNRLIWSGSNLSFAGNVITVQDRNAYATDTFSVWLCWAYTSPIVAVVDLDPTDTNGKKVIAIETDSNDDAWVIDSDNYMHKYLAGENYNEDLSAGFDLLESFPSFQGEVFDFAINFHNKSFYILTNHDPNGSLYRIECNGTYYPSYGGPNPNPWHGVLAGPHNGIADITIDNYDYEKNILFGEQDCQLIVGGGNANFSPPDESFFLTRIDSRLSNPHYSIRKNGCQCMSIDQINDVLRVVHGSVDGNEHFSVHQEPVNWY